MSAYERLYDRCVNVSDSLHATAEDGRMAEYILGRIDPKNCPDPADERLLVERLEQILKPHERGA